MEAAIESNSKAVPNASVCVSVGTQADDSEVYRATLDLRDNEGEVMLAPTATRVPAASCFQTYFVKIDTSPIFRTLAVVLVVGTIMYALERLCGGSGAATQQEIAQTVRNILKAGAQQAAALPVLEANKNATATTSE